MRGPNSNVTKKDIINALHETGGVINDTIKLLNMGRAQFFKKWRNDPDVDKVIKEERHAGFEMVTDVLYNLCMQGDTRAISLYLKYNPEAKSANWVDQQQIVLKEEKPLTDAEKEQLKNELFG